MYSLVLTAPRPLLALILPVLVATVSSIAIGSLFLPTLGWSNVTNPSPVTDAPETNAAAADFAEELRSAELNPQDKGRAVFSEADRRNSGYRDMQVALRMVLISPKERAVNALCGFSNLKCLRMATKSWWSLTCLSPYAVRRC